MVDAVNANAETLSVKARETGAERWEKVEALINLLGGNDVFGINNINNMSEAQKIVLLNSGLLNTGIFCMPPICFPAPPTGSEEKEESIFDVFKELKDLKLKKFDKGDKNGKIDPEEEAAYLAFIKKADETGNNDSDLYKTYKKLEEMKLEKFDKDHNGKIDDREEAAFQAYIAKKEEIDEWDIDGDGKLDDAEREAMIIYNGFVNQPCKSSDKSETNNPENNTQAEGTTNVHVSTTVNVNNQTAVASNVSVGDAETENSNNPFVEEETPEEDVVAEDKKLELVG